MSDPQNYAIAAFRERLSDAYAQRDQYRRDFDAMSDRAADLAAQVTALEEMRDRHLQLIATLTRETPYPAELEECRSARRALIAEVGTLRAQLAEKT